MRLKPAPPRLIIKLKGNFNDRIKSNLGLELVIDTEYNPTQHVRIEGEVVGIPDRIESNPLTQVYVGNPAPRTRGNATVLNLYHYEPKWIHTEDTDFDVIEGDKVYFHYNAIDYVNNFSENNRDSWIETDEQGYEYHQLDISTVYCRIRDGKIKMLNGKVLVSQLNEELQDIKLSNGTTVKGTKTESGLITSLGNKPKYLEGIINYIGKNVLDNIAVVPGDRIMYLKNSEFKNIIEDKEYYVMSQWDIVARWYKERYIPIGKYVEIKIVEETNTFYKPKEDQFKDGIITFIGNDCVGDYSLGERVAFNNNSKRMVKYNEDTIFVREEDLYFKY